MQISKHLTLFFGFLIFAIVSDQLVKQIILSGFRFESSCISIVLTFNKGVAFSMLSFLDEWLKYIQIAVIVAVIYYVFAQGLIREYHIPLGLLVGSGISNIIDRFVHEGVVDYIFWHCGFEFAVFNLADALINLSVALIALFYFKRR